MKHNRRTQDILLCGMQEVMMTPEANHKILDSMEYHHLDVRNGQTIDNEARHDTFQEAMILKDEEPSNGKEITGFNSTSNKVLAINEDDAQKTYDDDSFATLDGTEDMDDDDQDTRMGNKTPDSTVCAKSPSDEKSSNSRARDPDLLSTSNQKDLARQPLRDNPFAEVIAIGTAKRNKLREQLRFIRTQEERNSLPKVASKLNAKDLALNGKTVSETQVIANEFAKQLDNRTSPTPGGHQYEPDPGDQHTNQSPDQVIDSITSTTLDHQGLTPTQVAIQDYFNHKKNKINETSRRT